MPQQLGSRFSKLWAAAGISNLGDGIMGVAFPLLVASITRDPIAVAVATVINRLPWLLFALVSGALVDRLDRRKVMVIADSFRAVVAGALGVMLLAGDAGLPVIYFVGFLLGLAETFFDTSAEAILPSLVSDDLLPLANGRLQAAEWVGNAFIGPPIGAFLFAMSAGLPFLVDSGTFVLAAVLVAMIGGKYRSERTDSEASLRADIGEGLSWLWGHLVLRTLSIMAGITNMVTFGIIAIFVLFIQDIVGLGDVGYGLIISALGVGGLIGAFISGPLVRKLGSGTTLLCSVGLSVFASLVTGFTSEAWLVAVMVALYGLSVTTWNVVAVSLRQSLTPDALRGRVASVSRMFSWGTQPVGALLGGIIASWIGLRGPFFVSAAVLLVMLIATAPIVNNHRISALKTAAGAN